MYKKIMAGVVTFAAATALTMGVASASPKTDLDSVSVISIERAPASGGGDSLLDIIPPPEAPVVGDGGFTLDYQLEVNR